jgi:methyltransferase (TIGR00027 family)
MSSTVQVENVSDTALWVATYRAAESARPDALFHDPLAGILAGERGRKIARQLAFSKIMAWVMVVRTVAIDRLVQMAIKEGVDTVLNLGSGLDTRPYRMDLPASLKWIEVDFPAINALKAAKLKDEKPRCRLERIDADLANNAVRRELFAKIGAVAKKVVVITEGVLPYLSDDEAATLAKDLAATSSFQFWIQDYRNGGFAQALPKSWRKSMKAAPFRFTTTQWFPFFEKHGWVPHVDIKAAEETRRINRPIPFIFPWSLLFFFVSKAKREQMKNASGFVMMKNIKNEI